jgi:hypothetical protein
MFNRLKHTGKFIYHMHNSKIFRTMDVGLFMLFVLFPQNLTTDNKLHEVECFLRSY